MNIYKYNSKIKNYFRSLYFLLSPLSSKNSTCPYFFKKIAPVPLFLFLFNQIGFSLILSDNEFIQSPIIPQSNFNLFQEPQFILTASEPEETKLPDWLNQLLEGVVGDFGIRELTDIY
jgi:hypothetical protein